MGRDRGKRDRIHSMGVAIMATNIELNWDQTEKVVADALQESLRLELRFGDGGNDPDRIEAYKLVLSDFMLAEDFQKFMHDIAKKESKYNAKRLAEAGNGL
jgi:hypothetical protein